MYWSIIVIFKFCNLVFTIIKTKVKTMPWGRSYTFFNLCHITNVLTARISSDKFDLALVLADKIK